LAKRRANFTQEEFDTLKTFLTKQLIIFKQFDEVVKVEVGAIINQKDEFDWKFKSK
jgi:hypothetical protein